MLSAGALLLGPSASAAEFRSLAEPAIAYDSPSVQGRRMAIILPGTPVEIVVGLDKWMKVRDVNGSINWVERRVVSEKRMVLVNVPELAVRLEPSANAPLSFEASKEVVLELVEAPRFGWIKVRHPDGATGFARAVEVWGL